MPCANGGSSRRSATACQCAPGASSPTDQALGFLEQQPEWEPFSKIALDGEFAMEHHDRLTEERVAGTLHRAEFLDRSLRSSINRETERLETGLTFLATVGSTAPFIGLFGTVWGIMNAFRGLSNVAQATLAQVAPGIAEALVATAIGLFAAIPAVVAYNRYTHDVDRLAVRYETFIEEFSNILQRQMR